MTTDQDLSARLAELPSHWKSTAPRPHHRGEELLPIVYADPGSNGWYYRERKPDSVVAYVRLDHHERAVQAAVAKAVEAITAERDAVQAELRVALGGCDANGGWNHRPISIPSAQKDIFCQDCGEMLDKATAKRHLSAAANRTPSETPAAIRARKGDAL